MNVQTESIWHIAPDDRILWRNNGEIRIDEAHQLEHLDDTRGIIPIESGLSVRDFAVFLTYLGNTEGSTATVSSTEGYIVGYVNTGGSGALIHGDLIDAKPQDYIPKELLDKLKYIDEIEGEMFEMFGLHSLLEYVRHKKAGAELVI